MVEGVVEAAVEMGWRAQQGPLKHAQGPVGSLSPLKEHIWTQQKDAALQD